MPEFTKTNPLASFATTCCLCVYPVPVDKEGMCTKHYAEFGSKAWKQARKSAAAPKEDETERATEKKPRKVRAFRLAPLHKPPPVPAVPAPPVYKDPRVARLAAAEAARDEIANLERGNA